MSLMKTLGKVAMGIMVAKGVSKMMGGNNSAGSNSGLGGLLGSLMGGSQAKAGGGIGDLLGGLMGGGQSRGGADIAGMLGGLLGGNSSRSSGSPDLAGMLGGLLGGQSGQASGGLGGLLDSLGGSQAHASPKLGNSLNTAFLGNEPETVSAEEEKGAEVMLKAMISAAKSDGKFDDAEQKKLLEHLGDASEEEMQFVKREMQAPIDLPALVSEVPAGLEQQVYLMSLLAIDLDSKEEAMYLDQLAKGLNISNEDCNAIHAKLGVPPLYA